MLAQLEKRKSKYQDIGIISDVEIVELKEKLSPLEDDKPCPKRKWFTAPEMAQLLADAERKIVVIVDVKRIHASTTFVPLFGLFDIEKDPIVLLNCDNKHWMHATIDKTCLPPINPYSKSKYRENDCKNILQEFETLTKNWQQHVAKPKSEQLIKFRDVIDI